MRLVHTASVFTLFLSKNVFAGHINDEVASDIVGTTLGDNEVTNELLMKKYTESKLSSCKNFNYLIKSLEHRISDDPEAIDEDEKCDKMVAKQSTQEFWEDFAGEKILEKIKNQNEQADLQKVAKNIILFVGGGMNVDTISASRIQAGKWAAKEAEQGCGEEHELSFDKFPYSGFCKTYALDSQTPSSRSAGTALLSGFKSKSGSLNCFNDKFCKEKVSTRNGKNGKKEKVFATPLSLLTKMKRARGVEKFKTGIVSNTQFFDGTTAAAFAKQKNFGGKSMDKIAGSLDQALKNKLLDLSFTGGKLAFEKFASGYEVLTDKTSMDNFVSMNSTGIDDPIVGLFADYDLAFEDERCTNDELKGEPSLSEMTGKAVSLLAEANENGFFLMVEAGNIERAHQKTQGLRAVNEAVELDLAVKAAMAELKKIHEAEPKNNILKETLIVVTADHGHTWTFGGWDSPRGLKVNKGPEKGAAAYIFDKWGIFSNSLPNGGYYAGPGTNHKDLESKHENDIDVEQHSAVRTDKTPISAEDVPVFAKGPMAHLFTGVHEQSYVGNALAFAACTKEFCGEDHCKEAGFKC